MALNGSGLFVATFVDMLDDTALDIDWTSDTDLKAALYTNSITTPDLTTAVGYGAAPFNVNEVSGAGYTAGGAVLTGTTLTGAAGVMTFDATDAQWAASTITAAEGVLIYDNSQTGKNGLVLVDLGSPYSTSNGTLLISWSASGIAAVDLVP
ncbi:hypothetical protein E1286_05115 [Nonomuraea terrae]|uniref:Uncharacterized protein n=1 Tax=Nonomuraea terrae TaxID=2530383 RepID=A0A4R4Z8N8_9ACTN|nr:hypothetical protein [Nonomuraea terrae]TDD54573.1 hypothetical protein E1286_05115 [Nonomuraea terrae]